MSALVLTVIGADRPGLVGQLSAAVADHGGNWLQSSMSRLGGHFAGILLVEVDDDRSDDLVAALESLGSSGLTVHVERSDGEPERVGESWALELVGNDRTGIVRQITTELGLREVNVEELVTERTPAPMGGGMLFTAKARVQLPPDLDPDALQSALEAIGNDLMVDISLARPEE